MNFWRPEPWRRVVPQHGLAPVHRCEGAHTRHHDLFCSPRSNPVRFGCERRMRRHLWLADTQDMPGHGTRFGIWQGRDGRDQTPRGLQAMVTGGHSAHCECMGKALFSTPCGILRSHPSSPLAPRKSVSMIEIAFPQGLCLRIAGRRPMKTSGAPLARKLCAFSCGSQRPGPEPNAIRLQLWASEIVRQLSGGNSASVVDNTASVSRRGQPMGSSGSFFCRPPSCEGPLILLFLQAAFVSCSSVMKPCANAA